MPENKRGILLHEGGKSICYVIGGLNIILCFFCTEYVLSLFYY